MSADWRESITQAGSLFGVGFIMCALSEAIVWCVHRLHSHAGLIALVPFIFLVGAIISWRPNR